MRKKYDYISFDIFDTLVLRAVVNPSDVFEIVEKLYKKKYNKTLKNFSRNRQKAAGIAFKKHMGTECTVKEIYSELEAFYTKNQCTQLQKLEIEAELNVCNPNREMVEFYNKCIKNGIQTIITSDMYLDAATIKKILSKCGIHNYKKLFLSSETKVTKSRGKIFDVITKELKTKNILHIGDNKISDYVMPKIHGIHSRLYRRKNIIHFIDKKKLSNINYARLAKLIESTCPQNDYYYKFGYAVFGPILYGFTKWLIDNTEKNQKLFFLARDGYVMEKAYQIVTNRKNHSYLYASRRSIVVPSLWMEKDLMSATKKHLSAYVTELYDTLVYFGLEKEDIIPYFKKNKINLGYTVPASKVVHDKIFIDAFNHFNDKIIANSKSEYETLIKYYKQEGLIGNNKKKVLVDIGWNGSMQRSIVEIFKFRKSSLNGMYVGFFDDRGAGKEIAAKGYLVNKISDINKISLVDACPIFESCFLAPYGSTKKFQEKSGNILPIFFNYSYSGSKEEKIFQTVQNAALDFTKTLCDSYANLLVTHDHNIAQYNFNNFSLHPTLNDINNFGDLIFDDKIKIAAPKQFSFYLLHPKEVINDFYKSGWKIGFLKRLTRINLFYDKIIILASKILKY